MPTSSLLELQPIDGGTNPYLNGNYAPVRREVDIKGPFPVDGAIPPDLRGLLLRNGPNPSVVADPDAYHWFSGDGMVHGIEFGDGRALGYRNRLVQTRRLARSIGTRVPKGTIENIDGPANTHIINHAGRFLALCESGLPHRLTPTLETAGIEDFDSLLRSPMTAHPKIDPITGGMAFFGYDPFGPPFLRYHEMNDYGEITHSTEIELERSVMMHDFVMTRTRVVFLEFPVVADFSLAGPDAIPYRWDGEGRARLGVLDRFGPGGAVRWFSIDPCYVFHVANAFDDGDDIVADVCRYDSVFDTAPGGLIGACTSQLHRWRLSPSTGSFSDELVDDRAVEFPRIDPELVGSPYRHLYANELHRSEGWEESTGLLHFDRQRDLCEQRAFPEGQSPGEPIFVRAADGRGDDEGWVLSVVYDHRRDASDVVILDATRFGGAPEAVVHLPVRVPNGFHGSFVPEADYR